MEDFSTDVFQHFNVTKKVSLPQTDNDTARPIRSFVETLDKQMDDMPLVNCIMYIEID